MADVTDVKDLGSGVIGGMECDHLAFRKMDVDWQIWIAQGSRPYPCRYDIATKVVAGSPEYSIQIRDWKTGSDVASGASSLRSSLMKLMIVVESRPPESAAWRRARVAAIGIRRGRPCRPAAGFHAQPPGRRLAISSVGRPMPFSSR